MPATRSSPRKSAASSADASSSSAHKLICTTPADRRLFLVTHPTLSQRPIDHFTSITLRHPRHRTPARYLLIDQTVLECQSLTHGSRPQSAFVAEYVLGECVLHLATPIDPLLLALPVLDSKRQASSERDGYFLSYDALFADEGECFPVQLWNGKERPFDALRHICDVRDGWDEPVYRLNNDKALAHLTSKVTRLAALLPTLPSTAAAPNPLHTALSLLSEYVSDVWLSRLCEAHGVDVDAVLRRAVRPAAQAQADGMEVVGADGLTERQSSGEGGKRGDKDKKGKAGVSAAVKKLQKSSTGSKSIASFFGAKPK